MDIKTLFAIIAAIISTACFVPYLKDIFLKKTKPHIYTWLIWTLTQATGAIGILYGGGGFGGLQLVIGTLFIFMIFLLSFSYGTKNITTFDSLILILALIGIVTWLQTRNAYLGVAFACGIDGLGYIPTLRKSLEDPFSETISTWLGFNLGNVFSFLALRQYNFLTLGYLITITVANFMMVGICVLRRSSSKASFPR